MRRTYLLSGGPQGSSSASAPRLVVGRRAASPQRGREVCELVAKARREQRGEAALQAERRRDAGRASSAAKSGRPSASTVAALGRLHAHRVLPAVEQRDLADRLAAARLCRSRPCGRRARGATPRRLPSTTKTSSRASSPCCQSSSPSRTVRRRTHAAPAPAGPPRPGPRAAGRVARNSTVSPLRHPGRASRTRARRA